MGLRDRYNFEYLVNEAERMVLEELDKELGEAAENVCQCQDCVLDMAAYALNNVQPLYRVSLLGSLYARAADNTDHGNEVVRIVRDAVSKIAANPSH